jgi:two-component system, OmpR family, alkaline phosphatase synthesis response regulator PhoP
VPKKILIVDDEADILKAVVFRLTKAGYDVITAEDGCSDIDMVKSHRPDLILLDLRLPVKDGFEVCRELKSDENFKGIPIVFLTASAGIKAEGVIENYKADGFIIKPFDAAALIEKVKSLIG